MKKIQIILVVINGFLLLAGCRSGVDENVVDFVNAAKTQKGTYVEPLPLFSPPKTIKYTAGNLRDPFEPFVVATAKEAPIKQTNMPDSNRFREPLEAFTLDSLKMVGTLEREGKYFALIKDSNGILYRVSVGNYMGQNAGKIEKITERNLEVKEWLSDGKGGWQEHWVTLKLAR